MQKSIHFIKARLYALCLPILCLGGISGCSEPVDDKDTVICVSGDCSAKNRTKGSSDASDVGPAKEKVSHVSAELEPMPSAQEGTPKPSENGLSTATPNANATATPAATKTSSPEPTPTMSTVLLPTPSPTPVPPVTGVQAMVALRESCQGCHGQDGEHKAYWRTPILFDNPSTAELAVLINKAKESGDSDLETSLKSRKSFEELLQDVNVLNTLIDDELARDDDTATVFQSIENKLGFLEEQNVRPKPMRPSMDDASRAKFIDVMTKVKNMKDGEVLSADVTQAFNLSKSWCVGCHSTGGSAAMFWDKANGSVNDWRDFAEHALESVTAKRMPPAKLDDKEREKWLGVLAFFQRRMPNVVADARTAYHGQQFNLGLPVDLNFVCKTPLTGREYINQLTMSALNRSPTLDEISLVSKPNESVSIQTRELLVARLLNKNEWRSEFIRHGLKKFAYQVVNADGIRKPDSIVLRDPLLQKDIADEFYLKLIKSVDNETSYKDIITSNVVWASRLTGPFYGATCAEKTKDLQEGKFVECDLTADNSPRRTFFSTLGFLAGKPSSMLSENNNYGRVARMVEVIRGQPLRANTAGEKGGTVKALPSCFQSQDRRHMKPADAPRGTLSVPESGNFCQGCHIHRNLAAGGLAFRPYGLIGDLMTSGSIREIFEKDPEKFTMPHEFFLQKNIKDAIEGEEWYNKSILGSKVVEEKLTIGFFKDLLNIGTGSMQEKACIVDGAGNNLGTVTTVSDLVQPYMKDDQELARGLARIIPRALANRTSTSTEVVTKLKDAWARNKGQLLPMLAAYYATDTYACRFE